MATPVQQNRFSSSTPLPDYQARQRAQQQFDEQNRLKDIAAGLTSEMASATGTSLQSLMQSPKFQELSARAPEMANNLMTLANQQNLQRLSNLGQGAATMLEAVKGLSDPKQKEKVLSDLIQQRKALLPQFGFGTEDTEEIEGILKEQGLDAALGQLDNTLQTAKSMGFALPESNVPKIKSTRIGKAVTPGIGDREIMYVTDAGLVPSGYAAAEGSGGLNINVGGADFKKDEFDRLWKRRRNTQKTMNDILRVQNLVEKIGPQALGTLGASGKIATVLVEGVNTLAGTVKNLGMGSDVEDPQTRVSSILSNTKLGQAAALDQQFNSLLTNLAYVIAKENDPGGRISGPDFDAAVNQIAASADDPLVLEKVLQNLGSKFLTDYTREVEDYRMLGGEKSDVLLRSDVFNRWQNRVDRREQPGSPAQTIYRTYQNAAPNDVIDINGLKVTRSQLEQVAAEEGKPVPEAIKEILKLMDEQQRGAR